MIEIKLLLVILTVFICDSNAESLPYITKCKTSDSACLKKSAQAAIPAFVAGLPEFKIEPLDPLHMDIVDGSNADLKFINTDSTVTGLKDCIMENVELDPDQLKLNLVALCDATFKSQYEVHGRVLIVPFEGDGDLLVVLKKLRLSVYTNLGEKLDKQRRMHWLVKNYKYNYELNGKSEIEMSNLFNGNEILSRAARQLISTSSNEVVVEIGPPVIKAIADRLIKVVNKFLGAVPVQDLILD